MKCINKISLFFLLLINCSNFGQSAAIDTVKVSINGLDVTFQNNGNTKPAAYQEEDIFWSSGFGMTGYAENTLWANGSFKTYRISDYKIGNVDLIPDTEYAFFSIKSSDHHFGESWKAWSSAVEQGARFYDGNNDGIYSPKDLNGDNQWNPEEDRPDLIGDYTAWCVYNDSEQSDSRYFSDVSPLGIEIKQTIFYSEDSPMDSNGSLIYIRYIVENSGIVSETLDSVLFAVMADPDLGYYEDDLTGCDTILNSVYSYNDGSDPRYGSNAPCLMFLLLQGPHTFIPDKTFLDTNNNGIFEPMYDIALDSAYINRGKYLGQEVIPGARNTDMTAHTSNLKTSAFFHDPDTKEELLYYLQGGKLVSGEEIDVCEWEWGDGYDLGNCDSTNNKFMYSGDPVLSTGWSQIIPSDVRNILSTGPFKLKAGEPVEIIVAYIVGRGTNALNSVTVAKDIVRYAKEIYHNNFEDLPVSIKEEENIHASFSLNQNYPNPFNLTTKITYSLEKPGYTTLKVYNIMAEEIKTLVSEFKSEGAYTVQFDANNLSTGVYFYTIKSNEFTRIKKMLFVK